MAPYISSSSPMMLNRWIYCNCTATGLERGGTQLDERHHGDPGFGLDKPRSGTGWHRLVWASGNS
jgi:hypothetical protein